MRTRTLAALGLTGAIAALAGRETWQRYQDTLALRTGRDYWRVVLPESLTAWSQETLRSYRVPSDDIGIHVDVYAQTRAMAPTVVLAHGLLTYGRLLMPLAYSFYQHGYTVVVPDLPGTGFSGGTRGDHTVGQATGVLVDVTTWARQRFDGPLYLMGTSLGGALAYAAAAAGAPVSAISCLDLFPFGDATVLAQLVRSAPWVMQALPALRPLEYVAGWIRLPVSTIERFDAIVATSEQHLLSAWVDDPLLARHVSLRSLISAVTTPPVIPFEQNTLPVLVINQAKDAVLDPAVTRASYERLGGPKRYVELPDSAHWSLTAGFYERLAQESIAWFGENHAGSTLVYFPDRAAFR